MEKYVYFRKLGSNGRPTGSWIIAKCSYCGNKLLKDKDISGDFYPVNHCIILMSFCPNCGRMKPLMQGSDMLSNRKKRRMAIKIATHFDLGFNEITNIALESEADNCIDFFKDIEKKTDIPLKEIKLVLE